MQTNQLQQTSRQHLNANHIRCPSTLTKEKLNKTNQTDEPTENL